MHPEELWHTSRLVGVPGWDGNASRDCCRVTGGWEVSAGGGIFPFQSSDLSLSSQNGSNTRCQVVRCHLGLLAKGTEVSVGLLRLVHSEFFRRVSRSSLRLLKC